MRWLPRIFVALVFAAATVAGLLLVWWRGWHVDRHSPDALAAFLSPSFELRMPTGDPPFPTVVQFHGCGGLRANQRRWAEVFVEAGWASLVVDSNGPRELEPRWVCSGLALSGMERSGDVWVALAHARSHPSLDSERIVLAGWSHGGWSIFDLLDRSATRTLPHNLREAPPGGLSGLSGLVLVYPFCGVPSPLPRAGVPSLFVLSGADRIAPPEDCEARATTWRSAGDPVHVERIAGAPHAFDERHPPGVGLGFDAEATRAAEAAARRFLERLVPLGNERGVGPR